MTVVPEERLRPIDGPSALGGDWRRSLDLLIVMAMTDFKRTYFGTTLGYVWSILRPLMLFGVLLAVFTEALGLGNSVRNYPVLLLLNIVVFGFFQESTSAAVGSLVAQEGVLRKTHFPRLIIPLAVVLTALTTFAFNMVVVIVFLLAFGVTPMWTWLLFPVVFGAIFVLTIAVSLLVSALYPRFRDVSIIYAVAVTSLFYGTPLLYPITNVSSNLRDVLAINPFTSIFMMLNKWVVNPDAPTPPALLGWGPVAISAVIYVAVCILGAWVFRREAPRVAEAL